jgi:hypothetical protein
MGFVSILSLLAAAVTPAATPPLAIAGNWIVDLRLSDKDPPYSKPMVLTPAPDGSLSGEFYESNIEAGRFNNKKGHQCVAFRTSDNSGPYQHSACLEGKIIKGISWSTGRNFLLQWTATRAK